MIHRPAFLFALCHLVAWTSCAELRAEADQSIPAEVAAVGMDPLSGSPVVLLQESNGGKILPIWVGWNEARAIDMELRGIRPVRPLTHDLMASLLTASDARVDAVVIHDLREGTYFSLLHGTKNSGGATFTLDSRPSDALALALRVGAAIRIEKRLLIEIPTFDFLPGGPGGGAARFFGAVLVELTGEARERLEIPAGTRGVLVVELEQGHRSVLQRGDVLLAIDGNGIASMADLVRALSAAPRDSPVRLQVLRGSQSMEVEIPAASDPAESHTI